MSTPLEQEVEYRRTHHRLGYALGSRELPDNRASRRAIARSWRGVPIPDRRLGFEKAALAEIRGIDIEGAA